MVMAHIGQIHEGQAFTKYGAEKIASESIEEEGVSRGHIDKRFVFYWKESETGSILIYEKAIPLSELKNDEDIYQLAVKE